MKSYSFYLYLLLVFYFIIIHVVVAKSLSQEQQNETVEKQQAELLNDLEAKTNPKNRNTIEEIKARIISKKSEALNNQKNFKDSENEHVEIKSINENNEPSKKLRGDVKLLCQILIIGTLLIVVCAVPFYSKCFRKNWEGSNFENNNCVAQIPELFDSSKPYRLQFDNHGECYATPLASNEIPPLPTYLEAIKMPKIFDEKN